MEPNTVDQLYTEKVLMHGPAFDGSGEIVERHVVRADVTAYRVAGYETGPAPKAEKVYTEADAIAHNDGEDVAKPAKKAVARKKK